MNESKIVNSRPQDLWNRLTGWVTKGGTRRWVDYVFIALFILLIVLTMTTSDVFLTQRNLTNLQRQIVTNGLLSLGMLVVILTGGIDLSVGPVVALSGILVSGFQNRMPLAAAIPLAVFCGGMCGALNGFLISRFKLQPFIVTLATLGAIRGFIYVYSETPITPENPAFRQFFGSTVFGVVPVTVIIMLACYLVFWLFVNRTTAGRSIVAIGGNEEAVRLAGVNVTAHILLAYILSGMCAGLAGVLLASRVGIAQPSVGAGFELDAIASTVIGGAALGGGGGCSVIGTLGRGCAGAN